ncbi:DUF2913 family protein [Salmonella enterica]
MLPPISAGCSSRGRSLGVRAQLAKKLDYIWRSTTGNILEQTALFRLIWGLETAKNQQWLCHILSDTEWLRLRRLHINPDICAVYIPKSALEKAFSETGGQIQPVPARITGNVDAFARLLSSCGWLIKPSPEKEVMLLTAHFAERALDLPEQQ